ncbi:hypothetical protein [Pseudoxanthomonas sp. USHLN014]|uniref:hypothetical protein n=1 Tax=Pseudoxanthomonas sp. USHLN014 TaxID=3081297 RepID=UPI00301DD946
MRLLSSLLFFALGLSIGSVISAVRDQPLPETAAPTTERVSASGALQEQGAVRPAASPGPSAAPSSAGCGFDQVACPTGAEASLRG